MTTPTHSQAVEAATRELMGHIEATCLIKDDAQPHLEQLVVNLILACSTSTRPQAVEDIEDLRESAAMLREIGALCREQQHYKGSYTEIVRQAFASLAARPLGVVAPVGDACAGLRNICGRGGEAWLRQNYYHHRLPAGLRECCKTTARA
ncbi:hypothetical protein [Polaromonas sp.]|uniref:hypothetical protein n=1 Tax=Polaromonas sp. TaxID=1869339 RepID=UPI00272F3946|nr:hypothetical protein [Polaromonas sp.]MDP1887097.1 hypothetical protein [Polaromonas sp.]